MTLDGCCGLDDCINFLRLTRQRYEAAFEKISKDVDWLNSQEHFGGALRLRVQSIRDTLLNRTP